jgi:hypothetical protein
MRRIKVLGKQLSPSVIEAVWKLLGEAGCSLDEIEVVETLGEPTPECDDEIVLLLMSAAVCADPDLDAELAKTPNGGRRAICIWPGDGSASADEPDAVGKYAYSIISWSAEKLRAALADDDDLIFETSSGAPRPTVDTERNLCVGEKAQP